MKKSIKKLIIVLMVCFFASIPFIIRATYTPIVNAGGSNDKNTKNESDGVVVSKTIEETDLENYFDITLKVTSKDEISSLAIPSSASIVLVIDNSGSMKHCMDGTHGDNNVCNDSSKVSRLDALKEALNGVKRSDGTTDDTGFVDYFFKEAKETFKSLPVTADDNKIVRELGIVTFSYSASTVMPLTSYDKNSNFDVEKATVENYINGISGNGATNPASGLAAANTMLENSSNSSKYIIFLTDGLPTSTGGSGSTYNNQSAINARKQAEENVKDGIQTFVIGVGVGDDTAKDSSSPSDSPVEIGYNSYDLLNYSNSSFQTNKEYVIRSGDSTLNVSNSTVNSLNKENDTFDNKSNIWVFEKNGNSGYRIKNSNGQYLVVNNNSSLSLGSQSDATVFSIYYYDYWGYDFSYSVREGYGSTTYHLNYSNGNWYVTDNYYNSRFNISTKEKLTKYEYGPKQFKEWLSGNALENGKSTGRGIGYVKDTTVKSYYDVVDKTGLKNAYDSIFKSIKEDIEKLQKLWVVTDPVPSPYVEFVNFYKVGDDSKTNSKNITNGSLIDYNTENSAEFKDNTISWKLRESDYIPAESTTDSNPKEYVYKIKYRVRLKNEVANFVEGNSYNTNGTTQLKYATVTNGKLSEDKFINFKVPQVRGYLGEIEFSKTSNYYDGTLEGAQFKLTLDKEYLKNTYGNEYETIDENFSITSVYENGVYKFKNIPSGYKYIMTEVTAPAYHVITDDTLTYKVSVLKNEVLTNLPDDKKIVNEVGYGEITVKKQIVSSHNKYDTDKEFNFTITLSDNAKANDTLATNVNGKTIEIKNRKGTFTLHHNESIVIYVPAGVTYTIEENDNEYTATYDGNKSATATVGGKISTLVKNTKNPISIEATKIWKNVDGFTSLPNVEFKLIRSLDGKKWESVSNSNRTIESSIDSNKAKGGKAIWSDLDADFDYQVIEITNGNAALDFFSSESKEVETGVWEVTNTCLQRVELPEAGSSMGLILMISAMLFIISPIIYKMSNLYLDRRISWR